MNTLKEFSILSQSNTCTELFLENQEIVHNPFCIITQFDFMLASIAEDFLHGLSLEI